jgi:DNA processing protein
LSATACEHCVRRSALLGLLAGRIEIVERRRHGCFTDLLGLDEDSLIAALSARDDAGVTGAMKSLSPRALLERARSLDVEVVCVHDDGYPPALRDSLAPPAVVWATGSLVALQAMLDEPAIAIVGARRASSYGLDVAATLGRDLAAAGVTTVSGMALGIDSAVHTGSLQRDGRTLAVLAGGVDRPYPAAKRRLHAEIVQAGCVISELPPGTASWRWAFLARNRVIAALATMTVVVEAAARSGALTTAARARELGRDVGAVPGRVTSPLAVGPNALIADGAALIRDARDVLDAVFGAGVRQPEQMQLLDPALGGLLDAIANGNDTLDTLVAGGFAVDEALAGLADLELAGLVSRGPGGRYLARA